MLTREKRQPKRDDLGAIHESSTSSVAYDIPTLPEIGTRQTKAVVESLNRAAERRAQSSGDRAVAVEEAMLHRNTSLKEKLGDRKYQALVDYSWERRRSAIRPGDYQPRELQISGPDPSRTDSRRESREFLEETGIDSAQIEIVNADFRHEIESIFKPTIDPNVAKLDFHKDAPITTMDQGFTKVAPPFHGWWSEAYVYRRAGSLSHHNNLWLEEIPPFEVLSIHGHFGHISHFVKHGAGGYDGLYPKAGSGNLYLLLTYNTEVGFWFTPNQPGPKDLILKMRCKHARFDIWRDDEFGWSDSESHTWSGLRANVIQVHGQELQTEPWHLKVTGNPENTWLHLDWIPPETTFFLTFRATFPPEPVYISVGCVDEHRVFLNDVSTDQTMNSKYILEEVLIS